MEYKMKKQPLTPGVLGHAMKSARRKLFYTVSETAQVLRVSERDLCDFEQGHSTIPIEALQTVFAMGLTLMRARNVQHDYARMRRLIVRENLIHEIDI